MRDTALDPLGAQLERWAATPGIGASCRGSLIAKVASGPSASAPSTEIALATETLPPNQPFAYTIRVQAGELILRHAGTERRRAIDPSWTDMPVYFMAGAALAAPGTHPLDGASATFLELTAVH